MKYFSVILASSTVVMSLVLSYFLLFTELASELVQGNRRQILVAILLFYSVYRIFRIYKQLKNIQRHEP